MGEVHWTGALVGQGTANTNLPRTAGNFCSTNDGAYSTCGTGLGFNNTKLYYFQSNVFTIAVSSSVVINTAFKYSFNLPAGSTWTINYELWDANGVPFKLGNLNLNPITGTGSKTCQSWTYLPQPTFGTDPSYDNLIGDYFIRIVLTTNNTDTSATYCATLDDIWFYYGILSAVDASTGLSKPTYSTTTGTGTVNGSGELRADITFTKSTQSSVNCGSGSGSGNTPPCSLPSVKGIYQVIKRNKSTDETTFVSKEDITIPYQTLVFNINKTAVVFENSTHTYEHSLSYEDWKSDGINLEWKTVKTATPAKPARTATLNYVAGAWIVTLNGAFMTALQFNSFKVNGGVLCTQATETDDMADTLTINAGATSGSLLNNGLTCASKKKKFINSGTVNGSFVTNGTILNFNGQQLTMVIPSTCTAYAC
jgi:hypothetical protein